MLNELTGVPESKELSEDVRNARVSFGITKFIASEELPGTIIKVREVARGRRQDHKGLIVTIKLL